MKQLSFFAFSIVALFCSCGGSSETQHDSGLANISIEYDTVMVDSGDEFLFLQWQLMLSDVSPDRKYLYNFDNSRFQLEKIDLDNMRLETVIPFEKEGPNGVGTFINYVGMVEEDKLFLSNFREKNLFDLKGKKITDWSLKNESLAGDELVGKESLDMKFYFTQDKEHVYTLISDDGSHSLGLINIPRRELKKVPLKGLDRTNDFRVIRKAEQTLSSYGPSIHLNLHKDKMMVSHGVSNELYVYDSQLDSIFHYSFNSELTDNERKNTFKKEVETEDEFMNQVSEMRKQVDFGPFNYDPTKDLFYRLSFIGKGTMDEPLADVFLTVFNNEFKMLGETRLEGLQKNPSKQFAKDGKLYLFENLDDEMAFITVGIEL